MEATQIPHAAERAFLDRIARAERLLAAQRRYVLQLAICGIDGAEAQALLQLMESIAEQFHVAWKQLQTYRQPAGSTARATIAPSIQADQPASAPNPAPPAGNLVADTACAQCGLRLSLENGGAVVYDMRDWARRCRHQMLQTPLLCQLLLTPATTRH